MKFSDKIWLNGHITSIEKANTLNFHQGLNYGACVYEGIRCYDTKNGVVIFRLDEHLERFLYSARTLHMELGFNKIEIEEGIKKLLKANKIRSGYIRPIAFYSEAKMGINILNSKVTFMILVWPWKDGEPGRPVGMYITKYRRLDPASVDLKAKISGYYANALLGYIDAREAGYDQPIFLDKKGYIAEGAVNNIFVVKQGVLYTPKLRNMLGGITRDTIIKLARDLKFKVIEKDMRPEYLKNADEVFLTGTGIELQSVKEIAGYFKSDIRSTITEIISKRYKLVINGQALKFHKWLTIV